MLANRLHLTETGANAGATLCRIPREGRKTIHAISNLSEKMNLCPHCQRIWEAADNDDLTDTQYDSLCNKAIEDSRKDEE